MPSIPIHLVSAPFGTLDRPSLGLGLLQAGLEARGIGCRSHYLTLDYAAGIGADTYQWLSARTPVPQDLAAEWLFAGELRDEPEGAWETFRDQVLLGGHPDHAKGPGTLPAPWMEVVAAFPDLRARSAAYLDAWVDRLLAQDPKVVGFTTVFEQTTASLALAKRLKARRPDLLIVMGGANCEGPMGRALFEAYPFLDAVFSGESDLSFPAAMAAFLETGRMPGGPDLHLRPWLQGPGLLPGGAVEDMDALPFPAFDDYFEDLAASHLDLPNPGLMFETSRGCWWGAKQHCTFCGLNGGTMAFRAKSAERALAEFDALTARHPGAPVVTSDNILDLSYFKTFLPALAARGQRHALFYEVKANLTRDQVRTLKAAGVTKIQPGIESLDDEVLARMRKGVRASHNLQLLKDCAEVGIDPGWNLLGGFPGEDPGAYARMAELLPLLHHLPPPSFCVPVRLDRFSPNFEEGEARGFRDIRPMPAYAQVFRQPGPILAGLAYYFAHSTDGPGALSYMKPLQEAVADWKAAGGARLSGLDQGHRILVLDTRAVAPEPIVFLEGAEGEALRAVARATSEAGVPEPLRPLLPGLEARKLAVRLGDRWLGLVLFPEPEPVRAPQASEAVSA